MKVPRSKIVPCQGVLGSSHSLTFGLITQVSGLGPLGPLVVNINFRFSQINNVLFVISTFFVTLSVNSPPFVVYFQAPIKKKSSGSFDYDCTLTNVRAIKK